jgi:osmotically-inducible protein OsmY
MSSSMSPTVAAGALLLAWSVAAPASASDDTWISTKIRIALMTTDGAGRNAVKVDTEHGKVTLHGTVDSQAVKAADKDVKEAVEKALKAEPSLEGIKLKSVEDGFVFLDGSTTSLAHELRAIETAYGIPGVRQVASGIETKEK